MENIITSTTTPTPASPTTHPHLVVLFVLYDFATQFGGTYHTFKSWVQYFQDQGDKVYSMGSLPTDSDIARIQPDVLISGQWASIHIDKYIQKWQLPHAVLTFGREQYVWNGIDSPYPALVIYSNTHLKEADHPHKNGHVIRDPILMRNYILEENGQQQQPENPQYITLIGSPPNTKGHDVFVELARLMSQEDFLLVTNVKEHYKEGKPENWPKNLTLLDHIYELEELKNRVYNRTKLLIVPSTLETYSRVSVEATAAGIPCLISNLPALSDVTLGKSNYIKDYHNAGAWHDSILHLLVEENWSQVQKDAWELRDELLNQNDEDLAVFRSKVKEAIPLFHQALAELPRPIDAKGKVLIVMGNGPSLKDVDLKSLKGFDSFGLNAAYRAYEKLNWWPTYFGCFDFVVCKHHAEDFSKLVKKSPIERFFFLQPKFFAPDIQSHAKFQKINFIMPSKPTNYLAVKFEHFVDAGNSGANACQAGILMGYKKIILLGVDCNYVEFVDGSKVLQGSTLVMEKTPEKNPNYWFDDYQQKGDVYHIPNAQIWHVPFWKRLSLLAKELGIDIVNCSPITKLDCFRKGTLSEELK